MVTSAAKPSNGDKELPIYLAEMNWSGSKWRRLKAVGVAPPHYRLGNQTFVDGGALYERWRRAQIRRTMAPSPTSVRRNEHLIEGEGQKQLELPLAD